MLSIHPALLAVPHLYLDPGSGSLLFQLLLGGGLSLLVLVKIFWSRIKGLFTGNKAQAEMHTDDTDEEER